MLGSWGQGEVRTLSYIPECGRLQARLPPLEPWSSVIPPPSHLLPSNTRPSPLPIFADYAREWRPLIGR